MIKNVTLAAMLSLAVSGSALAAAPGFFVQADLGHAFYSNNDADIDIGCSANFGCIQDKADENLAYGISLGYQWNEYLATSIGYRDFGKQVISFVGDTANGAAPNNNNARTNTITLKSAEVLVTGSLPLKLFASVMDGFEMDASVGAAYGYNRSVEANAFEGGTLQGFDSPSTATVFTWGAGGSYIINDNVSVGVHYNSLGTVKGDFHGVNTSAGMVTGGVRYTF